MANARSTPRRYHIYCDESGFHGSALTGFGSLWLVHERRGDFHPPCAAWPLIILLQAR